jgi:hypothetical protein
MPRDRTAVGQACECVHRRANERHTLDTIRGTNGMNLELRADMHFNYGRVNPVTQYANANANANTRANEGWPQEHKAVKQGG